MELQYSIIAIYLITLLKSVSKNKNKVLDLLLLISAALLFSFRNLFEDDTYVYNNIYEGMLSNPSSSENIYGIDSGFVFLMKILSQLGISFYCFRLLLFLLSCILIFIGIKCITNNYDIVFCLYLFFPFCYDRIQIRQFFSYAIVIFAIRYLIMKEKKIIKYIICVIAATLIHSTAIVYLLYLFAILPDQEYIKKLVKIVTGLFVICVLGGVNIIGLFGNIVKDDKFTRYGFGETDYRMNVFLQFFEIILFGLFLYLDNKLLIKQEDEKYRTLSSIFNLSIVFLPFVLVSLSFERLMRPFIILTYGVVAKEYEDKKNKNYWIPLILVIVFTIIRMSVSFGYIIDLFSDCELIRSQSN